MVLILKFNEYPSTFLTFSITKKLHLRSHTTRDAENSDGTTERKRNSRH